MPQVGITVIQSPLEVIIRDKDKAMAKWPKSTSIVITSDKKITPHPAWLHAVFVCASVAGAGINVYNGQDTNSGELSGHFDANANVTSTIYFNPPRWMGQGIYIDVEDNISHVTVHFTPLSYVPEITD